MHDKTDRARRSRDGYLPILRIEVGEQMAQERRDWAAHTRMAYTEPLPDQKAATAISFMHRARAWFAAHGITHVEKIVTDNGACYRADAFARSLLGAKHKRTKPYTPKHNGKVERYNRILAEEFLYARTWTSEAERSAAVAVWNVHYNYHRPHSAADGEPPAARAPVGVTNVMTSYS